MNPEVCTFAHSDRTLAATLSGGSWSVGLPLDNLKVKDITLTARSADLNLTSTRFFITLADPVVIPSIVLYNLNCTTGAKVRVGTYNTADWNDPNERTAWLDMLPGASAMVMASYIRHWHHLPTWAAATIIGIEIDDTANPAGYLDIGRAMLMDLWQPERNMTYGLSYGEDDGSSVERTRGGARYIDKFEPLRTITMKFEHHTEESSFEFKAFQRWLGITGELFFILQEAGTTNLRIQRNMMCQFAELSSVEYLVANLLGYGVGLIEIRR